jgi:hypothetical protein
MDGLILRRGFCTWSAGGLKQLRRRTRGKWKENSRLCYPKRGGGIRYAAVQVHRPEIQITWFVTKEKKTNEPILRATTQSPNTPSPPLQTPTHHVRIDTLPVGDAGLAGHYRRVSHSMLPDDGQAPLHKRYNRISHRLGAGGRSRLGVATVSALLQALQAAMHGYLAPLLP